MPDLGIEMKPILEMSQEEHPAENFYFIKNNGKCISTLAYTSHKIYVFFVDNPCEFVGNLLTFFTFRFHVSEVLPLP